MRWFEVLKRCLWNVWTYLFHLPHVTQIKSPLWCIPHSIQFIMFSNMSLPSCIKAKYSLSSLFLIKTCHLCCLIIEGNLLQKLSVGWLPAPIIWKRVELLFLMALVVIKTGDCMSWLQESFNSATDLQKETLALLRLMVSSASLWSLIQSSSLTVSVSQRNHELKLLLSILQMS